MKKGVRGLLEVCKNGGCRREKERGPRADQQRGGAATYMWGLSGAAAAAAARAHCQSPRLRSIALPRASLQAQLLILMHNSEPSGHSLPHLLQCPPPPHPVPLDSVLSGVYDNSKAARVDEKNNNDRTPHANSKLHNAEESCRGVLLSLSFSSTRAALLFSSIPYVWHTLRRHCRGASKIM